MSTSPLPRSLARPLQTLRRDLLAATAGLRGHRAAPFHPRDGSAWPAARVVEQGREVVVDAVERLGPDAARLWLRPADGGGLPFRAGQFLTLLVPDPDGAASPLRRAYSLCSDPGQPQRVAVAVRRLAGGRASPRLVDGLAPGERLRVLGPSGSYGHALAPGAARHHLLVAGGSGVTPHLALLHAILAAEPASRCTVLLADRQPERLMLRAELEALAAAHPDRVALRLVVEQPPAGWTGGVGRLDPEGLAAQLAALGTGVDPQALWYLCGPEPMLAALLPWLAGQGVPDAMVAVERFRPAPTASSAALPTTAQRVTVRLPGGGTRVVVVPPGRTILDAARAAGVSLPFSCGVGGCGACRQQLVSGRVAMRRPNCLRPAEEAAGAVLTCVGHPLEASVLEPPGGAPAGQVPT